MTSCLSYEMLLNLRSMDIINLKQAAFFQIRVTVYQTIKDNNHFALPFLILRSESNLKKLDRTPLDPTNQPEIDNNNSTFLTRKLIARSQDDRVDMSDMCLFKGVLEMNKAAPNQQIRMFCELLSFQQSEVEVIAEWQGSTLHHNGSSYLPIYFSSYKFTCNVNATLHCVTSSVAIETLLQNEEVFLSECKSLKKSQLLKMYSRPLEESIEQMKQQLRLLTNHRSEIQNDLQGLFLLGPDTYRYCIFNSGKKNKQMSLSEAMEIETYIDLLQVNEFISKFKQSIYKLNQIVYQLWKRLQGLLMNSYNQTYDKAIRIRYRQQIADYHKHHSFLSQGDQSMPQSQVQLFVYPFEKHDTKFKINKDDLNRMFSIKSSIKKQLIVFVHGYQASSFDMQPLSNYLKFKNSDIICLISAVNEGRTQQSIEQSAHRLAIEIKNFVNSLELKDFQISFICHSLGGLIGRACLKYLQLHKQKFNQFVSLCSPHLGYLYHSSTLISTSLWILNKVKKDPSMIELTMSDHQELQKTYIFGLSSNPQLGWFNKVWLFASKEDEYVPYWSAILEEKNFIFQTQSALVYNQLLKNLTNELSTKILRCQIVFNQKTNDLSTFIGRTAHIKMLNYLPAIQLFSAIFIP